MNLALALSAISGCGWATNIVAVRWALLRKVDAGSPVAPLAGGAVALWVAAFVPFLIAVLSGATLPAGNDIWRFAVVGLIAPGSSQGLFVAAINAIGSSRSSVLVSTNPMWSVLLAMVFLGEDWRLAVLVGTVLIVVGGAMTSWERGIGFREIGALLALATAFTFGLRDVVARHFNSESDISIWWAAALVLGIGALVASLISWAKLRSSIRREFRNALPQFVPSGIAIGVALTALFAALDIEEIGIVAPLVNAVQSVVVVALGAIVFGAHERSNRILVAITLVILGGALITSV